MKLVDRMKIAETCAALALVSGAMTKILPRGIGGDESETLVEVRWPELALSFAIGGCNEPGVLCNFYGAARDLRHDGVFDSINTVHRRKATTWHEDSGPVFLRWFAAMCRAVDAGEVFA